MEPGSQTDDFPSSTSNGKQEQGPTISPIEGWNMTAGGFHRALGFFHLYGGLDGELQVRQTQDGILVEFAGAADATGSEAGAHLGE
jgi:hypothetical protein